MRQIENPAGLSVGGRLRFLARDSLVYGGASAFNAAFSLITFPLLARHFSVADYGLVDLFSVVAGFLTIAFVFGQDSAVARFFYEHEDTERRRQIVSQSLVLQLCVTSVVLPLLWIGAGHLGSMLSEFSDVELLTKVVLLQLPFQVLLNFSQNLLKWTFSRRQFIAISIGSVVVRVFLLMVAVLWFDVGVIGVFAIVLVVQAFFGTLGMLFVVQWLTRPAGFGFLRQLVPFAVPYGVICLIGAFAATLERSIVYELLGSDALGLYAAGAKVAMLIALPIGAFQTAWAPFSLAIHKEGDAAATYNWVLKGFTLAICSLVLVLTLLADPVIRLLASERYASAAIVVFPLTMGLAVQATSWITEIGIGLSKRTYLSLYVYGVFLVVTWLAIYFGGHTLGLWGVALGVMTGYITKAVHATYLAQRAYRLPWPFKRVVILMTVTLLVGFIGQALSITVGPFASVLVFFVGLLLLLTLSWLWLFNKKERLRISQFLASYRGASQTKTQSP